MGLINACDEYHKRTAIHAVLKHRPLASALLDEVTSENMTGTLCQKASVDDGFGTGLAQ